MLPQPALREATYADLVALPDNVVGEIIDGVLHVQPRPGPVQCIAKSSAGGQIGWAFGRRKSGGAGPGGWWILFEPELKLGRHVLVPDIAGWRRDRMPTPPQTAQFHLAPDWVCEVVSPDSARKDRMLKLPKYVEFGVAWAWLMDPVQQLIEVFQADNGRWVLVGSFMGDDVARIPPFDAVQLDLSAFWDGGEPVGAAESP